MKEIKVIVAEDEELIRNNMVRKIESLDSTIKVIAAAQDGKEALEFIRKEQPDLLITDIRMPVMDGMELIKTIFLKYPRIRSIITSGYAEFEYAKQALKYNVNDYLLKPISEHELRRVLSAVHDEIEQERSGLQPNLEDVLLPGMPGEEIVARVQRYMRDHFDQELSMERIAKQFNFNASYLSKIFIKHTGDPPSKHLMSLRISEAQYLLTHQRSLSVKEVGERVGYPDQFYFSRIFKQVTGCTPKDYRK